MNRILVATDFSFHSEQALDYAISFANAIGINDIHLINAKPLPQLPAETFISLQSILLEDSINIMNALKSKLEQRSDTSNIIFTYESSVEDAVTAIRNYCKKIQPDLIVMGTKGRSGTEAFFLGSVCASVIENIDYPIIVVPNHNVFMNPKSILLGVDLKPISSLQSFSMLKNLCLVFDAKLHLVHVNNDGKISVDELNEKKKLLQYFHGLDLQFYSVTSAQVDAGIEVFVEDLAPDIVTVLHRHHSFFEKVWKASISKNIARHSQIPMLSLSESAFKN